MAQAFSYASGARCLAKVRLKSLQKPRPRQLRVVAASNPAKAVVASVMGVAIRNVVNATIAVTIARAIHVMSGRDVMSARDVTSARHTLDAISRAVINRQ